MRLRSIVVPWCVVVACSGKTPDKVAEQSKGDFTGTKRDASVPVDAGPDAPDAGTAQHHVCPPLAWSLDLEHWAKEVLLGPEFVQGPKLVRRFAGPVRVEMIDGEVEHRELLGSLVEMLNDALAETPMQLGLAAEADGESTAGPDTPTEMLIWFTSLDDFGTIAAAQGFPLFAESLGQFYLRWNPDQTLTRAYVLLASDVLVGSQLTHYALEGLAKSLGPGAASARFPDSIFYQDGELGGNATRLSCHDRALLRLLYSRLNPGDGAAEITEAVRAHWE